MKKIGMNNSTYELVQAEYHCFNEYKCININAPNLLIIILNLLPLR